MGFLKRLVFVLALLLGLAAINVIASDPAGPTPDRPDLLSKLGL